MPFGTRRLLAALAALMTVLMLSTVALGEPLRILLLGVDTLGEAGRSDTMVLAQVDPEKGDVRLLSFLRDLYVSIPGRGMDRLNAAYFHGGTSLIKRTLRENFGVTADRVAVVHFPTLESAINTLGGVEVEVTPEECDQLNQILMRYNQQTGVSATNGLLAAAGLQTLNGKQALSFCRIRKLDSDFQRTGRQQRVLAAALSRVRELDALTLLKASLTLLQNVETDITPADLAALTPLWRAAEPTVRTAHVPFDGTYTDETIRNMMVLVPNLSRNRAKLKRFLGEE